MEYYARPPSFRICPATRQRGQGAVEFLLAATPVLLLGLSSIEAVHWYFARQAVSLALVQAGRAAITQNADPTVLDQAFTQALLPMYAGPNPAASRSRLQRAITRRERDTGLPAWRIHIISPSQASFQDFASLNPDLPQAGAAVIDNDYLQEQHEQRLAQGWQEGRGPASGQTTLQANTLVLHLTWLHEPLLPGMKQLLKQIAPTDSRYGSLAMAGAGYLPLQRQVALVMQSHPIAWEMPGHGRVSRAAHTELPEENDQESRSGNYPTALDLNGASSPGEGSDGANGTLSTGLAPDGLNQAAGNGTAGGQACAGLWCLRDYIAGEIPPGDSSAGNMGSRQPVEGAGSGRQEGFQRDDAADAETGASTSDVADDCPGCCD